MNARSPRRFAVGAFAFVTALCVTFVVAGPVSAQLIGGGNKHGRKKKRQGATRGPKSKAWSEVGSHWSRIIKFQPAEGAEDERFVGTLKFLPVEQDAKAVSVRVPRSEDLDIELGGHKFTAEDLADIPLKGLFCTVTWGYPEDDDEDAADADDAENGKKKKKKKRSPKDRQLRSIRFDQIEVRGRIDRFEDDMVVLKVRPKNGKPWPHIEAKRILHPDRPGAKRKSPKPPGSKKLKLKLFDDFTKYVDANRVPLDLGDFEVDQEIEATMVFGTKVGIMVTLRAPGVEVEPAEDNPRRGEPQRRTTRDGRRPGRRRP